MKKNLALMMTLAMVFCMTACGNTATNDTAGANESNVSTENNVTTSGTEETKPETITIQALNANKEMADIKFLMILSALLFWICLRWILLMLWTLVTALSAVLRLRSNT